MLVINIRSGNTVFGTLYLVSSEQGAIKILAETSELNRNWDVLTNLTEIALSDSY